MRTANVENASTAEVLNENTVEKQKYDPGKKMTLVLKALDKATTCAA